MKTKLAEIAKDSLLRFKQSEGFDSSSYNERVFYHPTDDDEPSLKIVVEYAEKTTLQAVMDLSIDMGDYKQFNGAALNFASATMPGGGFMAGASAQEESLCRSSVLYFSLATVPQFYENGNNDHPFYSPETLFTKNVSFIKNDAGDLLEKPVVANILTAAAPYAVGVELDEYEKDYEPLFVEKLQQVLRVAGLHKQRHLILGAWGCGAFGNPIKNVARIFKESLPAHSLYIDKVTFAIPDKEKLEAFRAAFR